VLYIYGRVLIGTSVVIKTVGCELTNVIVRGISVCLALQSYYYITKMVGLLRSRVVEHSERKQKGIKMQWKVALRADEVA
jgi:hypothetical protein